METRGYWSRSGRISRRRVLAAGGVASGGLVASALVGCGDDDDEAAPAASGTAAAGQPKRGGDLKFLQSSGDTPHLDVHQSTSAVLHAWGSGIAYSRLLRRKLSSEVTGGMDIIPEGDAAESWEQPDNNTYVFKLPGNVKWQNIAPVAGRLLTAEDVVYSHRRQLDLKIVASYLPGLTRITAPDPRTVRIEIDKPDADFLIALSNANNKIVAREAVDLKGDLKEPPVVGTGAWIFREWVPSQTVKFVRNPDYFRPGLPYADTLEIYRIADPQTAQAAFRTGQVQMLDGDKPTVDTLKSADSSLQVIQTRGTGANVGPSVIVAGDIAPTNDKRVRQAISKAINRQQINDAVAFGTGWQGGNIVALTSRADLLPEGDLRNLLAYDAAGARQLLQQAGLSGWRPKISTIQSQVPIAELVQAQLKQVGIDGTIEVMEVTTLTNWFVRHDKDFVVSVRAGFVTGTNADLLAGYRTGGFRNVARLGDPELDRLIDAQLAELKDRARRTDLIHQAQRKILDLSAISPIYTNSFQTIFRPFVKNLWNRANGDEPALYESIWLDR